MNMSFQKRMFYVDETHICEMDRLSVGPAQHILEIVFYVDETTTF